MPKHLSPRYGAAYGWLRGEDWWGDPVSGNFVMSDMLAHPVVKSMTTVQPPPANTLGDMYIVPIGGAGAFTGQDGKLAMLTDKGWVFLSPLRGMRVRCDSPDAWFWYTGPADGWKPESWIPGEPAAEGSKYDISFSVGFEPLPNDVLGPTWISEPATLLKNAPGSGGRIVEYPPGPAVFSIRRNGTPVGTISFTPTSFNAVLEVSADAIFAKGDLLDILVPNTLPEGFKNFGITLRLVRAT